MTEPPFGWIRALLPVPPGRFPLLTTVAWGGVEKDFTGRAERTFHIKAPDIRKLKGVIGADRRDFSDRDPGGKVIS